MAKEQFNTEVAAQETFEPFDVTCVVGTVMPDAHSPYPPHVAAMMMVARHDADGYYSFPRQDGRTQFVTVEFSERSR